MEAMGGSTEQCKRRGTGGENHGPKAKNKDKGIHDDMAGYHGG